MGVRGRDGNAPAISVEDIQSQSGHPTLFKERLISSPDQREVRWGLPATNGVKTFMGQYTSLALSSAQWVPI